VLESLGDIFDLNDCGFIHWQYLDSLKEVTKACTIEQQQKTKSKEVLHSNKKYKKKNSNNGIINMENGRTKLWNN
jgi:hypothetical protein